MIRSAWVIARRDYVATVFSRTFLLFLIGPLMPLLFAALFGALAAGDAGGREAQPIAVTMQAGDARALVQADARLTARLGPQWLAPLDIVSPPAAPARLLSDPDDAPAAVLSGSLARPLLTAPRAQLKRLEGPAALLIAEARAGEPPAVNLATHAIRPPATAASGPQRLGIARGGQLVLFVLTMILAGMLISNLVEEKSSKVIEVLAAAVPVDAIFAGKLAGMLAVSLTGIAAWGGTAGLAAWIFLPHDAMPAPAVGWPMFIALGISYFVTVYLLLGALYLGIGAQAASVREVQTLSMPLTMAQLLVFGLASAGVARPDSGIAIAAAIIPWSSPFAMIARAAQEPALWPHPIALAWQLACLAAVIAVSARLFRLTVLSSGRLTHRRRLQPLGFLRRG